MPKKINIVKISKVLGIGVMSLFLLGCQKDSFLLAEENGDILSTEEMVSESNENPAIEGADAVKEDAEAETEENDLIRAGTEAVQAETVGVHICGAVQNPGVYFLEQGARICHVIEMAGGLKEEADGDYVNQALVLEDGMKVTIPTKEEVERMKTQNQVAAAGEHEMGAANEKTQTSYVQKSEDLGKTSSEDAAKGKVDINTADEALLCTLPGIGQSRAKSIIDYRTKNGSFKKIEDVMKVSGIKEAAFEKIKDLITVTP